MSAIAGCGGDGDGGGDGTTTGGGDGTTSGDGTGTTADGTTTEDVVGPGDFVDQRATYYTGIMTNNPQEGQWNPFNPSGNLRPYYGHAKIGTYSPFTQEFLLTGLEGFEKDGDTLTLTLRDHHTWSPSGDPVTADDLRTKYVLEDWITGSAVREGAIDAYEVAGEKQLDLVLSNADLRADLFFGAMSNDWLDIKHSVYQEWVESFEDAAATSEEESVREEVVNFRWENENVQLSGQFEPPEMQENAIILPTRQDDGKPLAGMRDGFPNETLYTELELHVVPQGQTEFQLVQSGQSIETNFRGSEEQLQPALQNDDILTQDVPTFNSYVMIPNPTADYLGDRAVRQAIAYALDLERAADVSMPNNLAPVPLHAGVMGAAGTGELAVDEFAETYGFGYEDFITEYPLDDFRMYGTTSKMDEAAAVLEDAGYTQNSDDMWEDEEGDVVSIDVLSSDVADYFLNQTLEWATSLRNLGFESEADVLPYDQFFNQLGAGDYDTTIVAWYGTPPFGYNMEASTYLQGARGDTTPQGWVDADPITVEVPEFGNTDGSMIEVNVTEKLDEAQTAADDETYNQLVSELAWTSNEALPTIFGGEIIDTVVADQGDWIWPDPGDAEFPIVWRSDAVDRGVPLPRDG